MKRLVKLILFGGAFGLTTSLTFAQTQSRGEVTDQEFIIRKDRVLTVPVQPRVYEKLPVLPQPKGLADFNYRVNRYPLTLEPLVLETTPIQKPFRAPQLDLYPGFLRVGYGNFASPLLEARYMGTEVDVLNFSLNLGHQSFGKGPVQGEESSEAHTNFGGDISYFADVFELFGGIDWNQDRYSFYGVDPVNFENPEFEIPDNVFTSFSVKAGIRDIEKVGPFSYEVQASYRNFNDSYMARESEIGVSGLGEFRPSEDWKGQVGISYYTTNPEDLDYAKTRTYLGIRPEVQYTTGEFRISAGLNIISENDSIEDKSSDFRIFPNLKASYQFAEEFGFFGEFSGDVKRNTYFSFVNENPYLGPSEQLLNTIQNYKVEGGIEGQFQEAFHYRAAINVSRYNNLSFFVNNYTNNLVTTDSSRFSLVYDDKSTVFNINGELGFKFSDVYSLGSRLDLYQYDLSTQAEAWHLPTWELRVNNQVTPIEGLLVQANLNFMGGLKARGNDLSDIMGEYGPYEVVKLKTIADLQLKADYQITNRFAVFAEGNNILNGKNTRWLNYPVRGIQLIGGVSMKF
ncbi:TonB-dependent receptor [Algoriphagus lutimaris]|uniref:TonB-dependent receptor n=1 Tax=Algoriphagus lutimaris TaxID=613197 RepID=UPI00196B0FB1|nr:TonB-dependent receptor [Algoriphagus lutimaris]MBN3519396.1 TonB-dependent receptor [Algoriphagus lutimaris]